MTTRGSRAGVWILIVILSAYAGMGVAYAWFTPRWEAPDEPAHYNYIRYLLEHADLPVLERGDYDFAYLERIKAARFPPGMSIDPIRYESHQPPLYYVVGATLVSPLPESWRILALRLLSVLLGLVLLVVVYGIGIEIFPDRVAIALGATAFVATVPMHVAMSAAINNDTAAELILALVLLLLVRRVTRPVEAYPRASDVTLGLLMGLGLLTKTTTYIALPLTLLVILAPSVWGRLSRAALQGRAVPWSHSLRSLGRVFLVAFLVAAPWLVRNALVYGGLDVLGLLRHNAIMVEQPKTAEWLARLGWMGLAREFSLTTFRSFWAQFGWMGILVDERLYQALALLCLLAGLGFLLFLIRDLRKLSVEQKLGLSILALSLTFTVASYLWYNIQFVQHQGRYLFPALVPLALFAALGIWKLLDRDYAWYWAGLLGLTLLGVGAKGWGSGNVNKWLMAICAAAAALFVLRALLPKVRREIWYALPFLGLWTLDIICLAVFIVPYFR